MITNVLKRDGRTVKFDITKIIEAICKVMQQSAKVIDEQLTSVIARRL